MCVSHKAFSPCSRSILYQRGIYPPESFEQKKQYGLTMMVTSDEGLTKYLTAVLAQMSGAGSCTGQSLAL